MNGNPGFPDRSEGSRFAKVTQPRPLPRDRGDLSLCEGANRGTEAVLGSCKRQPPQKDDREPRANP